MPRLGLSHVTHWVFDLDQTLYPHEAEIMVLVERKMTDFVMRQSNLSRDQAYDLQKQFLNDYGTTLAGLMANFGIEPQTFLDEVHDVSLDSLQKDPELIALIAALDGPKVVFTNADEPHATRLIDHMGMNDLFDGVFHLGHADLVPKPALATFERMLTKHNVPAKSAAFFEDSPRNLKPAHGLGMKTVLVGPKAIDNQDAFVDFRSPSLKHFLTELVG